MRKLLATTALVALLSMGSALAGNAGPTPNAGHVTFMLGIAVEFGDESPDFGITGKILSSNLSNQFVVGGGVTYFPMASDDEKLGLDLSAGLNLTNFALLGGYDFLRQQPQLSGGFVPTETICPPGYTYSGSACVSLISDRRRKRTVVHLATLSDGTRLYAFRYLWSETVYVGVMAQDLLADPRFSHAVATDEDGFYVVDYDRLNLRMVTIEEWNEAGVDAVVLGSRRAELLVTQAA